MVVNQMLYYQDLGCVLFGPLPGFLLSLRRWMVVVNIAVGFSVFDPAVFSELVPSYGASSTRQLR